MRRFELWSPERRFGLVIVSSGSLTFAQCPEPLQIGFNLFQFSNKDVCGLVVFLYILTLSGLHTLLLPYVSLFQTTKDASDIFTTIVAQKSQLL